MRERRYWPVHLAARPRPLRVLDLRLGALGAAASWLLFDLEGR